MINKCDADPNSWEGSAQDDLITGTNAADRIDAYDGDDTLGGGAGDDVLGGGTGNDCYLFGYGDGVDRSNSAGKAARREADPEPVISVSYFVAVHAICSSALNNPKPVMGNQGFKSRRWRHGDAETTAINESTWRMAA